MHTSVADLPADVQLPYHRLDGATEVLLVRHGSTAPEVPGAPRWNGHGNPPLNTRGILQAEQLAHRLAHLPAIDSARLFVTPLRRTQETAQPLTRWAPLPVEEIQDLREVGLGIFEGSEFERRRAMNDAILLQAYQEQRWDVIPGAESSTALGRRVLRGLNAVADRAGAEGTAIAVVHGGVIAHLCHLITSSEPFAFIETENASITTLIRSSSGRWRLRSYNDTAHLNT